MPPLLFLILIRHRCNSGGASSSEGTLKEGGRDLGGLWPLAFDLDDRHDLLALLDLLVHTVAE